VRFEFLYLNFESEITTLDLSTVIDEFTPTLEE
jgi:hypothetical protein